MKVEVEVEVEVQMDAYRVRRVRKVGRRYILLRGLGDGVEEG